MQEQDKALPGILWKWDQDPGTQDLRTLRPGTRELRQSLDVGSGISLRFKSGTAGTPLKV